jgi:CRP/FNR family transcriptional regulator, cyclic AMP receptor protein
MTLADLADTLPTISLEAGTSVHAAQWPDVSFVIVADGLIVLRSAIPGSARRTITCHAGGGSLFLPPGDDESLVALTPATLVVISSVDRDRLLESPTASRLLLDGLAETLRQKQAALASMSRLHHVDRVREKLIELARDHGRVGRDGIRLDFPLTHDLLGEMTGSARETVTRALDELQREGFVQRRGRTYSVHIPPEELALNGR